MTFTQALEKSKSGSKITRASWRDQYVALTTGICYRSVKGDTVDVSDGTKLDYFISGNTSSAQQKRIAKLNGSATGWWLRSPHTSFTDDVWYVRSDGYYGSWNANDSHGVRPALVLPSDFRI